MENNSTYKSEQYIMTSTFDEWKGKIGERIDNVEQKTDNFIDNFGKINDKLDNIWTKLNNVDKEVAVLKTQFSMWKWFISLIPIAITLIYFVSWLK